MKILAIIVIFAFLYWFFILRPGRLDFWKIAGKYPDEAFDFFRSKECWKVFEGNLQMIIALLFLKMIGQDHFDFGFRK